MVKVTNTRIEAKNRPHSKEKALSSITFGAFSEILAPPGYLIAPINPLLRCHLKLTELEQVKTV